MLRHAENSVSLGTFDPDVVGARQRLIWQQRLRCRHDIWDVGLPCADTAAEGAARASQSTVPTNAVV
ncbi:MAG: hypothetical protein ACREXY_10875, partial [Gammaproteobacteria bacterium]